MDMDKDSLRTLLQRIDDQLTEKVVLDIRGGAAVPAHGLGGRTTGDLYVLPASRFSEAAFGKACEQVGIAFNPEDKDFMDSDYAEQHVRG